MRRNRKSNSVIAILLLIFLVCTGYVFYSKNREKINNLIENVRDEFRTELTASINQLNQVISSKNEEIMNLMNENSELSDSILELRSSLSEKITLLNEKLHIIENLTSDKESLLETVNSLQTELDSLNGQMSIASDSIDDLESQIAELEEQLTELESQITEKDSTITFKNGQITLLTNQVNSLEIEKARLEEQITTLTAEKTALEEENSELTDSNETLTAQITELENQITGLNETLTAKNLEIENKRATITELNSQITTLTNEKIALEEQITALETQIATLTGEITVLNGNISDLNTQIASKDTTISLLNSQISGLNSQISTLQSDNQTLNNQIVSLNNQIVSLNATITSLNSQIETLQSQIEDLRENVGGIEVPDYFIQLNYYDLVATNGVAPSELTNKTLTRIDLIDSNKLSSYKLPNGTYYLHCSEFSEEQLNTIDIGYQYFEYAKLNDYTIGFLNNFFSVSEVNLYHFDSVHFTTDVTLIQDNDDGGVYTDILSTYTDLKAFLANQYRLDTTRTTGYLVFNSTNNIQVVNCELWDRRGKLFNVETYEQLEHISSLNKEIAYGYYEFKLFVETDFTTLNVDYFTNSNGITGETVSAGRRYNSPTNTSDVELYADIDFAYEFSNDNDEYLIDLLEDDLFVDNIQYLVYDRLTFYIVQDNIQITYSINSPITVSYDNYRVIVNGNNSIITGNESISEFGTEIIVSLSLFDMQIEIVDSPFDHFNYYIMPEAQITVYYASY